MFGIGSHMPIRRTFWYSVEDDMRYELATVFADWRDVAVDAAEDYHGNHDGWEGAPNISFTLTHRPTGYESLAIPV